MNHNNNEEFDQIPDKSPIEPKEGIDVGQVVAELFKLEDEDVYEVPQRSRRRSHRDNFEEYDTEDNKKMQQEKNGQHDGNEIEIDDIHFSMSKGEQSKVNNSPFPKAHEQENFQRMDIAEDTPRPSTDTPDQDINRGSSSMLRDGQFNTNGRESSCAQLSAQIDEEGIEPTELLKQRRKQGKPPSKLKRNVFICVGVMIVFISISVGALFVLGGEDSTGASVQVMEDEGPTVFVKQESSFEKDGQHMAALKVELAEPDDVEMKQNAQPQQPQEQQQTTNNVQPGENIEYGGTESPPLPDGIQAEGPAQVVYKNNNGNTQRPPEPTVIRDQARPQELQPEANTEQQSSQTNDDDQPVAKGSPLIRNTIQQAEDMQQNMDPSSPAAVASQDPMCSSLISNCQDCLDEQTCSQCLPGYEMHSGFCASWSEVCNANDETMATTKGCLHKKSFFGDHCQRVGTTTSATKVQLVDVAGKPSTDYLQCKKCKVHYFISKFGNECKLCSDRFPNCVSCGYTGAACQVCERGTYYSNGDCVSCNIPNCQECSFSDHCNLCNDGYKFVAVLKKCYKWGDPLF